MNDFFINIVSRVKNYSKSLQDQERFVEKAWCFQDENENKHRFIFLRDGRLLVNINDEVFQGNWEYIKGIDSLLIEFDGEKKLCKHHFIDDKVLILEINSQAGGYYLFANEKLLPNLNVTKYLQSLSKEVKRFSVKLKDNSSLDVWDEDINSIQIGARVFKNGELANGNFITHNNLYWVIKDGILNSILFIREYTDIQLGSFNVISREKNQIQKDDAVIVGNKFAKDGVYRVSNQKQILVKDGVVLIVENIPLQQQKTFNAQSSNSNQEFQKVKVSDSLEMNSKKKSEVGIEIEYAVVAVVAILIFILIKCNT